MSEAKPLQKPPGYREPGLPPEKLPPPPQLRKQNLPPSFYPQKKRRNCCRRLCCCFIIFTALLTLFFISFGGFLYLWYEPRVPNFGLKSFQVEKFEVTTTSHGHTLDSRIDISIEFKNSNRNIKFVYDKLAMNLDGNGLSGGFNMGQKTIPGFIQEHNNVTVVKFAIAGNQKLQNDQDAKKMKEQFRAKSLMMTVELRTGIGIEFNGLSTGTVEVKVVCGAFSLKEIQNGAMPTCKVFVFHLFNVY